MLKVRSALPLRLDIFRRWVVLMIDTDLAIAIMETYVFTFCPPRSPSTKKPTRQAKIMTLLSHIHKIFLTLPVFPAHSPMTLSFRC